MKTSSYKTLIDKMEDAMTLLNAKQMEFHVSLLNGCSPKFLRMAELYKTFANDWQDCLDFSDEMLVELYNYESYGGSRCHPKNGFAHGKKWLNLSVSMWKEDIEAGNLFKYELYEDVRFPHWWLDGVLVGMASGSAMRL